MLSVYFETYGCSNNQAESEIMKGMLCRAGFAITTNLEIGDILIINTCIVKGPTLNKMIRRIQDLSKLNKPLIVAGCMPAVLNKEITKLNKNATLVSTHNIDKIVYAVKKILEGETVRLIDYNKEIRLNTPRIRNNPLIAIIPISSGCMGNCSFCATRLAKGKLYSFPKECVLKEIKDSINSGCREIWLTSQDNAAYGIDAENGKKGETLIDLLKDILALKGRFFIRLGMMNPNHAIPLLNEMIKCYKDDKMYKFLHLPLQSGSNKVLGEMDRKYNADDFLKIVERFRMHFPDLTLSTDIICGYPTETEKDFEKTLEIIKAIQPDILNISRYWPMPGTSASKLEQLAQEEIIRRTTELMKLFDNLAFEKNKKLVNKEYDCLASKKGIDGTWLCRNKNYKLIGIRTKEKILGKIIKVKIKKATPHYLIGNILSQ